MTGSNNREKIRGSNRVRILENEIEESVSDEEWMKRGSGYASEEVYYFEVVIELDRLIT